MTGTTVHPQSRKNKEKVGRKWHVRAFFNFAAFSNFTQIFLFKTCYVLIFAVFSSSITQHHQFYASILKRIHLVTGVIAN